MLKSRKSKSENRSGKRIRKTGLPPGALIYTGVQTSTDIVKEFARYNGEVIEQLDFDTHLDMDPDYFYWLEVRGTNNPVEIEAIGQRFHVDPLLLEDILDTEQRPKFEQNENTIFVILKNLIAGENGAEFKTEQICLYFTERLLISFQEYPDDSFQSIKVRMQQSTSRIRSRRHDYLMYAIIDYVTDHYFGAMDICSDRIHVLESEINQDPDLELKNAIYHIRQDITEIRRILLPTREAISAMLRTDNSMIADKTRRYFRDVMDNLMQIIDINDDQSQHLSSLHDLFVSEINFRMTNVMKILTVVTSIFIPLTFITSLYGMNFRNMPELAWRWGYFAIWVVMVIIVISLLIYFKKKRWL